MQLALGNLGSRRPNQIGSPIPRMGWSSSWSSRNSCHAGMMRAGFAPTAAMSIIRTRAGVAAEGRSELAEPRFGEDDHDRLLAGQAVPNKVHRAGEELLDAAVEQGFMLIAGMGPDQDGGLSHSHRLGRVRGSRNPNTPWRKSSLEHGECSYC